MIGSLVKIKKIGSKRDGAYGRIVDFHQIECIEAKGSLSYLYGATVSIQQLGQRDKELWTFALPDLEFIREIGSFVPYELSKRTPEREEVYKVIDGERDYQDAGMGNAKHPDGGRHGAPNVLTPGEYLLAMDLCLMEAGKTWYKPDGSKNCLEYVRKVTALGVACMEHHGAPERKS